jgi:hypothetical protein
MPPRGLLVRAILVSTRSEGRWAALSVQSSLLEQKLRLRKMSERCISHSDYSPHDSESFIQRFRNNSAKIAVNICSKR